MKSMLIKKILTCCVVAISLLLTACATAPIADKTARSILFADEKFSPPKIPLSVADAFALDEPMRQYLWSQLVKQAADGKRDTNLREVLTDALFTTGELRLDYDAAVTRNASQTFQARAGNCLSLTMMAAAFARELGLGVHFQQVNSGQVWGRQDDLQLSIGHVNLVVGERVANVRSRLGENALHTIDFLRFSENHVLRATPISVETVLAMYMNNRAAESLSAGDINQAYWFAREAIQQAPEFMPAAITLAVIYRRHGDTMLAENSLTYVLRKEPNNTVAMANLITLFTADGRQPEAALWQQKLTALQPIAPFYNLDLGKRAIIAGDYAAARDFFLNELNRGTGTYSHELHFWLANAYYRLGEYRQTKNHLDLAIDYSPTRKDRDLYGAKRDQLQSERAKTPL
jgi:tetratricopeptide (TPR) repeat protein